MFKIMGKSAKKQPNLTSQYVRDYYDKFLGRIKGDYSDFRWFDSEFSHFQYLQNKRAISGVLGDKKFEKVLEIGPGDGIWTEILIKKSQNLTALDISEKMIGQIKKRLGHFPNLKFICADFLNNDLPSDQYDLKAAIRSFEYLPDKKRAIEEIHRLLKEGGFILIVTKNPYLLYFRKKKKKILHSGQIDINLLKKELEGQGFKIEKVFPAIFGRKLSLKLSRIIFDFLHKISLSNSSWLIPSIFKKYFSESFLILAQKL